MTNLQPALPGGCSMLGRSLLNVIIPATILLGAAPAFAESRLALVIFQSAYKSVPALPNPGNDASAVTQLLTDSGFEVLSAADLSQNHLWENVSELADKIAPMASDTVAMNFDVGEDLEI